MVANVHVHQAVASADSLAFLSVLGEQLVDLLVLQVDALAEVIIDFLARRQ
jgi:hypothetical protein